MALSAIYRTGQRFGVAHLVDVLTGKQTPRACELGHDRLPTFGVGHELAPAGWRSVFRQLVAAGLASVDIDGYGGLSLTAESNAVLRNARTVELRRDPAPRRQRTSQVSAAAPAPALPTALPSLTPRTTRKARPPAAHVASSTDQQIFEALRAYRLELARQQGVPPYVIFSDQTLQELTERKPSTLADMRLVTGIGDYKLARYGRGFLEVLQRQRS
jgi:ATP-dependent DNA helicase RecQ